MLDICLLFVLFISIDSNGDENSVDFEQALETQRHRLLRIIAGLVVLVGCLAVGPVSVSYTHLTLPTKRIV